MINREQADYVKEHLGQLVKNEIFEVDMFRLDVDYIQELYKEFYTQYEELMNIYKPKEKDFIDRTDKMVEYLSVIMIDRYIERDIKYLVSYSDFLKIFDIDIKEHIKERPHLLL